MRSMQTKHNTVTLVITGVTSACLFGAATPASKALLDGTQAQTLAGLLYLGAALGILPVVGLPLTFLSYGGTNLIMSFCLIGIFFNICRR